MDSFIIIKKLDFPNYHKYLKLTRCGFCKFCYWSSDYPDSHIEHSIYNIVGQTGCKYINSLYTFTRDDEGELEWKLKY